MTQVVACPICGWRGFRSFFPGHFVKTHPDQVFVAPIKIDSTDWDSRPKTRRLAVAA